MPVVDKLPALLRADLEATFEDVDNVFDISTVRHSLGHRKREMEIELKRVCIYSCYVFSRFINISSTLCYPWSGLVMQMQRLKDKFREIHEQLSSSQTMSRA